MCIPRQWLNRPVPYIMPFIAWTCLQQLFLTRLFFFFWKLLNTTNTKIDVMQQKRDKQKLEQTSAQTEKGNLFLSKEDNGFNWSCNSQWHSAIGFSAAVSRAICLFACLIKITEKFVISQCPFFLPKLLSADFERFIYGHLAAEMKWLPVIDSVRRVACVQISHAHLLSEFAKYQYKERITLLEPF